MKNPWVIIGVITLVLFGGAFWYASVSAEKNNEGVEVVAHIKGNQDATVTLVEYSDFQCPACAAFQPAINEVLSLYGEAVRLEYRHFPLPIHRNAIPAALAAEAAGQQGKFYEYHDLLFENQPAWSTVATPQPLFLQYADELGLDTDTFRRHMNASVLRDHVQAHFAEGRDRGVTGTPTFFLNGEKMVFQTYQEFIDQIAVATGATTTSATEPAIQFGI
jgi:protein-disulfide isomerase